MRKRLKSFFECHKKGYCALLLIVIIFFTCLFSEAEEKKIKYFSSTSFSFLLTGGNNKDQTFSFDTDQNVLFGKSQVNAKLNVIYAQKNNQPRSEVYSTQLKYNYRINSGAYILGFLAGERNRLAGNEFRFAFAAGAGFVVLKKKRVEMFSEVSVGRTSENFRSIAQLRDHAAYFSSIGTMRVMHNISSTSQFTHQNSVFFNFKNLNDWRIDSNTALAASISQHFALNTSFRLIYDNEPVEGFKATDYFFLTSLVIRL